MLMWQGLDVNVAYDPVQMQSLHFASGQFFLVN